MAFAARLGALTEELIEVIVAQPDPARLRSLKDTSLQNLRHHNFLRTNQFDIDSQLNGLEERFRVLNRDGLADALRENLDALPRVSNKFTPEVLHFLLELADQPVQNSELEDLEALRQPAAADYDPGLHLNWEEIAKEDDWAAERDIWKKVDFRADSSEDEFLDDRSEVSERSRGSSHSSVEAQFQRRPTDLIINTHDVSSLDHIRDSQSWRLLPNESPESGDKIVISELQAVREILFMLRGLKNDLFNLDYRPSTKFMLQHAAWKSFQELLSKWGEFGRSIHVLRRFARKDQQIPLLQVFRGAVEKRIGTLDSQIATIEAGLVHIAKDTVVSLMKTAEDLRPYIEPLCSLSQVIQQLEKENYPHPFRYLELLFDSVSMAQLEGIDLHYEFLGKIFFECFHVYLRPIREWMQDGTLLARDKTFFITEAQHPVQPHRLWESQFSLRRTTDDILHAPRFLQPAVDKIFTTGKSVVILKRLGKYNSDNTFQETAAEPMFNFETVVATDSGNFAPFSELFNIGFEVWMQSKHHAASARLRSVLFESCGLWTVLSDLQRAYLMTDGSRFDEFAHPLFNNLDLLNSKWHDRLFLTQSFQDAFGPVMDVHRVSVAVSGDLDQDIAVARKSVRDCLSKVRLDYRMSWPARIVITAESISHYQTIFTLLLQNNRARYILQRQRIITDGLSDLTSDQAAYYDLRSKLLWFFNSLRSYVSNIVIAPLIARLQQDLDQSHDVDAISGIHSVFVKRIRDSACLGSKLDPIRQSILEIMDLAIRLEDARQADAEYQADQTQELSRLSFSAPSRNLRKPVEKYEDLREEEDQSFLEEQDQSTTTPPNTTYDETLSEIRTQFDRQLQFICGGLRGAARASKDFAATRWDMLADVLEVGVKKNTW